jgi:hypothetical protein
LTVCFLFKVGFPDIDFDPEVFVAKKKWGSMPLSSWQQKPQARNLSPEIQV